ncbi:acetyl-CoA acetyltransferase [candidate division MSBL1 archaeon SCGC-AAA259E19]|uniref:Acetyl-CoA acetyltransferase n=1 Tax=candidate division MSBL1 archaeon SCGC-AAA259E19 TaxID=1698264 RepID=A0A133UNB0_9EURY|nr:acetyl-CoA acetyltransferase [candidate division MSBL1 archaeon SCGC-AAA259E19]
MRDVAIVGIGITKFGELWDTSFRDLFVDAGGRALKDAGMDGNEIDAMYVGNMSAGQFIQQEHVASLIADHAGLVPIPCTRVEAACASGGLALRQAFIAVTSGIHDIVAVGGIEKMTDILSDQTTGALVTAADKEWEGYVGTTFPGLYGLMARRHMHKFGTTEEQMAQVAVKNHKNGALNPRAQYQREITVEQVLNSPIVTEPLNLFDCSPITDGSAAVILAPANKARKYTDTLILISGSGQASGTLSLHDRESLTEIPTTIQSARTAYEMADVGPKDIDLAEVHDCFTIAEIMAIEDLGFCEKGEGGSLAEDGKTALNGEIPINTSGGLKSKGHPVGATGIAQAVEVVSQLRGDSGKRQVDGAEIGLTHNIGGSGGTGVVHILERGD